LTRFFAGVIQWLQNEVFFLHGGCSAGKDFFGEAIKERRWRLETFGGLVILMVREGTWRAGSYLLEGREP
jgi:hypothetical protein